MPVSASPVLPEGIKGTFKKGIPQRNIRTKAWCRHLSTKDIVAPAEYMPGGVTKEIS